MAPTAIRTASSVARPCHRDVASSASGRDLGEWSHRDFSYQGPLVAALILLLTPVQSPFFYFTLGTALLGGLLYGYSGAVVFSLLLVAVYLWSLDVRAEVDEIPDTFQTYVGLLPAHGVSRRRPRSYPIPTTGRQRPLRSRHLTLPPRDTRPIVRS